MAKKLGVFTSVLLGVAGGTAAAVFLATETGKTVKDKVSKLVKDYQDNHEEINANLMNKAQDLKDQTVGKYEDVKGQLESGELTLDDLLRSGKEKVQTFAEQIKEKMQETTVEPADFQEDAQKDATIIEVPEEDVVVQDDIEIDL